MGMPAADKRRGGPLDLRQGAGRPGGHNEAMSLLHFNLVSMTIVCLLLTFGLGASEKKASGPAVILGVIGLMLVIAANIYIMTGGWSG